MSVLNYIHVADSALKVVTSVPRYMLGSEEAVIHHYRRCPHVWSSCDPETIIDNSMARFRGLHERVVKVRAATKVRPDWTPEVNLSIPP